jgi:hypothetical protein
MLELLDGIAQRLAAIPQSRALLALGSVGLHTDRVDQHSDLDFFVITTDKSVLLEDLWWLGEVQWAHRNTRDGFKALVDGVFCEFAVLTSDELHDIAFAPGRVVWARDGFDEQLLVPTNKEPRDQRWLTDEILSNLYVGLHRWLRGEKLAAMRLIQGEALDHLLMLLGADDLFVPARRAEARLQLPWEVLAGGYEGTPAAAGAILAMIDDQNPMRYEVERLLCLAR